MLGVIPLPPPPPVRQRHPPTSLSQIFTMFARASPLSRSRAIFFDDFSVDGQHRAVCWHLSSSSLTISRRSVRRFDHVSGW